MSDTDKYEETDHPELIEFEGETLGDTLTNLLAEVKRLHDGIRSILSDYDITELIRDVPQDEWNFEQQALIRMKEMTE